MVRAAALLLLLLLILPDAVLACTCRGPRTAVEATAAHYVVRGRVLSMDFRPDGRDLGYDMAVTLRVRRSWKKAVGEEVVVMTRASDGDCGYPFVVGEEYIVPVYSGPGATVWSGLCSGVEAVRDADATLARLGIGLAPGTPPVAAEPPPDEVKMAPAWWLGLLAYAHGAVLVLLGLAYGLGRGVASGPRQPGRR